MHTYTHACTHAHMHTCTPHACAQACSMVYEVTVKSVSPENRKPGVELSPGLKGVPYGANTPVPDNVGKGGELRGCPSIGMTHVHSKRVLDTSVSQFESVFPADAKSARLCIKTHACPANMPCVRTIFVVLCFLGGALAALAARMARGCLSATLSRPPRGAPPRTLLTLWL
jgi:hypothetical protein